MKHTPRYVVQSVLLLALLSACASPMVTSERTVELRSKLTDLQSNPELSPYAPEAMADAESAVRRLEQPQVSTQMTMHLDYVADRKIEIAETKAREAYLIEQRKTFSSDTADARLASRTAEADQANQRASRLAAELAALDAKPSPKGMVVTLGDVLFATGRSNLNPNVGNNLHKLSEFMSNNPETRLAIEGHTDSVGSAQSNMSLSESRAAAVSSYLQNEGISLKRLSIQGMGESMPVATNESASGRQLNRRVEVTILD